MALLAHILGIFTSFVVPLIIWLIKKDDDEFIATRQRKPEFSHHRDYRLFRYHHNRHSNYGYRLYPVSRTRDWRIGAGIVAGLKANDGIAYPYPAQYGVIIPPQKNDLWRMVQGNAAARNF